VTNTDIDRMVAHDISGVASAVPGFSAARVTAFNAASFAMRGVGITDIIVYQDSPVGVTVDDFVMPSVQTQLLDTYDIQSVEILRGPQGTLFGKNTTGGAVNIQTKRPNMTDWAGDVRLGYGSFDEKRAQGSVDIPIISDVLAGARCSRVREVRRLLQARCGLWSDQYVQRLYRWSPVHAPGRDGPGRVTVRARMRVARTSSTVASRRSGIRTSR
jgi:hypothetical protein